MPLNGPSEEVIGRVERVEPYGVYLSTPVGQVLVHRTEVDWVKAGPIDQFSIGDDLRVRVYGPGSGGRPAAGSLKRLAGVENPYEAMAGQAGGHFDARVSAVFSGHTFVTLPNGTNGLLAPSARTQSLRKGNPVRVVVDRVDPERPEMDVSIVE